MVKKLKVDPQKGLTLQEAQARLQKYGPNAITAKQEPMGLKFLKTLLVQLLI
ncbi:cation-transporting P-type ATPase [Lactobacillus crispatus]|uniref:cation-transporting P-type ATPase n=1 Tax=Lactobacillus crispatus TaxID=47770 RepID=UPI00336AE988